MMNLQLANEIASSAVACGILQLHQQSPDVKQYRQPLSDDQRIRHRKQNLDRYYAKRDAFIVAGLTSQGKGRVKTSRLMNKSI